MRAQPKLKLFLMFVLLASISECVFAYQRLPQPDYSQILIECLAGSIGYCINPITWGFAGVGVIISAVLSRRMNSFFKMLMMGAFIGVGAGASTIVMNSYMGVGCVGCMQIIGGSFINGTIGLFASMIFLTLQALYKKYRNSDEYAKLLPAMANWYPSNKFFMFNLMFVAFTLQLIQRF
jgi:hypothetical protein